MMIVKSNQELMKLRTEVNDFIAKHKIVKPRLVQIIQEQEETSRDYHVYSYWYYAILECQCAECALT